ncbi:SCO family protein [Rhodovulum sp. PH10]|uniref:SCO family protein n=1 Tax=Rhodovulum sp. PH10 TaxID=1187851 RepID=UPI00031BB290|nr:SCO family protein [Rhodovulum sp. PH10]
MNLSPRLRFGRTDQRAARRLLALPVACLIVLAPLPAAAGLSQDALSGVGFSPPPNAHLPLGLTMRDADGRPTTLGAAIGDKAALLLPADYECKTTCGPALSIVAATLGETGLTAGDDFRLVLFGLDPTDTGAEAKKFVSARVGNPALLRGVRALTGDAAAIRTLTDAIGYHYVRDPENDAFAHPNGVLAVTADGRIARMLSSLALGPTDLRLALLDAGEGRVGGVLGRLTLLCYGFDPAKGIYTASIARILQIAGGLTVLVMAGAIGLMMRATRPHRRAR